MSEQNKAIARRIIEDYWNKKNPALERELFAPTCVVHTPDGEFRGLEGLNQLYNAYATGFPDFHVKAEDTIAEGNKVAVRYTFTGTHTGPLAKIPASGRSVKDDGVVIFDIDAGKVRDVHMTWDRVALLEQIGAMPAGQSA